jgi:hypothetical protein
MKVMKRVLVFVAVLGLAASVGAQSLTELAKKEKARRDSLKGRHAAVITNASLLRVQKTPAVVVTPPEAELSDAVAGEETVAADQGAGAEGETGALPSGSGAPSGPRMVPRTGREGPLITGDANRDQAEGAGTLDAQLKAAKEMVDLLTTKMNALRQQFESQDAMVPGSVIQQQLDETNQRLLKAQAQQARIEAMLAKKAEAGKAPAVIQR